MSRPSRSVPSGCSHVGPSIAEAGSDVIARAPRKIGAKIATSTSSATRVIEIAPLGEDRKARQIGWDDRCALRPGAGLVMAMVSGTPVDSRSPARVEHG